MPHKTTEYNHPYLLHFFRPTERVVGRNSFPIAIALIYLPPHLLFRSPNCGICPGFIESIPSYSLSRLDHSQLGGTLEMAIRSSAELVSTLQQNTDRTSDLIFSSFNSRGKGKKRALNQPEEVVTGTSHDPNVPGPSSLVVKKGVSITRFPRDRF